MAECPERKVNLEQCGCTYAACARRGNCCACVAHHRAQGQLPGCLFPPEAEKTYDRSIAAFVKCYAGKA